jgi:hypothetical protein
MLNKNILSKSLLSINKNINLELKNFIKIYKDRPIKNNKGGCTINHAFALYYIVKKLKPKLIIESGVYKGQTTWLIEKASPKSKLICIDINLSQRQYVSKKAKYSDIDFKFHDFSKIPDNTLVFFDDHVNHLERMLHANFFKIKNIIFEDNYDVHKGDLQTLKHFSKNFSFIHTESFISYFKTFVLFSKIVMKKILFKTTYNSYKDLNIINSRLRDFTIYKNYINNIKKNIDFQFEFPPLVKLPFKTKKPLLKKISLNLKEYSRELNFYNYITFVILK